MSDFKPPIPGITDRVRFKAKDIHMKSGNRRPEDAEKELFSDELIWEHAPERVKALAAKYPRGESWIEWRDYVASADAVLTKETVREWAENVARTRDPEDPSRKIIIR